MMERFPTLAAKRGSLTRVLAFLQALKYVHHTAHWLVTGSGAHGDHLMMQRLYTAVEAEVDVAGEKVVGAGEADKPGWARTLASDVNALIGAAMAQEKDPLTRSARMEQAFQDELEAAINVNRDRGGGSGIENWLTGLADVHQTNQYLLRQRLVGG